jgi:hypothetical protein
LLTDIPRMLLPDQPLVNPGRKPAPHPGGAPTWKPAPMPLIQVSYESASAARYFPARSKETGATTAASVCLSLLGQPEALEEFSPAGSVRYRGPGQHDTFP